MSRTQTAARARRCLRVPLVAAARARTVRYESAAAPVHATPAACACRRAAEAASRADRRGRSSSSRGRGNGSERARCPRAVLRRLQSGRRLAANGAAESHLLFFGPTTIFSAQSIASSIRHLPAGRQMQMRLPHLPTIHAELSRDFISRPERASARAAALLRPRCAARPLASSDPATAP